MLRKDKFIYIKFLCKNMKKGLIILVVVIFLVGGVFAQNEPVIFNQKRNSKRRLRCALSFFGVLV